VAGKRGNGEGSISRRKDRRWERRYTTTDNKRRSVYGKARREVAQKLARAISEKEHVPAFLPTNITVA